MSFFFPIYIYFHVLETQRKGERPFICWSTSQTTADSATAGPGQTTARSKELHLGLPVRGRRTQTIVHCCSGALAGIRAGSNQLAFTLALWRGMWASQQWLSSEAKGLLLYDFKDFHFTDNQDIYFVLLIASKDMSSIPFNILVLFSLQFLPVLLYSFKVSF